MNKIFASPLNWEQPHNYTEDGYVDYQNFVNIYSTFISGFIINLFQSKRSFEQASTQRCGYWNFPQRTFRWNIAIFRSFWRVTIEKKRNQSWHNLPGIHPGRTGRYSPSYRSR